jgi:hypothetical protein
MCCCMIESDVDHVSKWRDRPCEGKMNSVVVRRDEARAGNDVTVE